MCFFAQLVCVAWGQLSIADRINEARTISEDHGEQIEALNKLLSDPKVLEYADSTGLIHYAIAFRYRILSDHVAIEEHARKAINAFQEVNYNGYQYAYGLSFLGESLGALGEYSSAIDSYFEILSLDPNGRDFDVYGYAVNRLAEYFIKYEDYDSAIRITQNFLSSDYVSQTPDYDVLNILVSSSIAHSNLEGLHHLSEAKRLIDEAYLLYDTMDVLQDEAGVEMDMQQAAILLLGGDYSRAAALYQSIFEHLRDIDSSAVVNEIGTRVAYNASFAFQNAERASSALQMAQVAYDHFDSYGDPAFLETEYLIYDNLATSFLEAAQLDSALYYIKKGLKIFQGEINPSTQHKKYVLNLLYDQARIFQALSLTQSRHFFQDSAFQSLLLLDQIFDAHINEQLSEYSVANLKNQGLKYYQLAVDLSYSKSDKEFFWYFSEKTKGLMLLTAHLARRKVGAFSKLQHQIDVSNRDRVRLEYHLSQAHLEESLRDSLRILLNAKNQELLELKRQYSNNANAEVSPLTIKDIQKRLSRKQSVIQYQYGSNQLYALKVTDRYSRMFVLEAIESIEGELEQFLRLVKDPVLGIKDFYEQSQRLYTRVVEPLLVEEEEILIIADGLLHFIPFEALIMDSTGTYLLEEVSISYLPSGSFLLDKGRPMEIHTIDIIKPRYHEDSTSVSPLPFIDAEIAAIQEVFQYKLLDDEDVSKASFLKALGESEILHFGGHAFVDMDHEEQTYLALDSRDRLASKLLLGELYTSTSTTDLVILSACNTGVGRLLKGEGVSSLTRGFLYAGVHSTISTLWIVDDQSTTRIMAGFYDYLSQGKIKSKALRMSKLDYLSSAEGYQSHPFYWAGVIGTGNMGSAICNPINWYKAFFTVLLFGGLAWFLSWRFSKKPFPKIEFLTDWDEFTGKS